MQGFSQTDSKIVWDDGGGATRATEQFGQAGIRLGKLAAGILGCAELQICAVDPEGAIAHQTGSDGSMRHL